MRKPHRILLVVMVLAWLIASLGMPPPATAGGNDCTAEYTEIMAANTNKSNGDVILSVSGIERLNLFNDVIVSNKTPGLPKFNIWFKGDGPKGVGVLEYFYQAFVFDKSASRGSPFIATGAENMHVPATLALTGGAHASGR